MIDREAIAEDRVGDTVIPAGSTVIVYVYGAHHTPRYWPNPETFDPERFSKTNEATHPPFTYVPFGGGPRGCIGGNYAMLQILMILSTLLGKYDLELPPAKRSNPAPWSSSAPSTASACPSPAHRSSPPFKADRNPQPGDQHKNGVGQDLTGSPALNQHA
jgi:cytochrome P450